MREGCTARDGTCEVTIGPDTTTIFYLVSPSSVCQSQPGLLGTSTPARPGSVAHGRPCRFRTPGPSEMAKFCTTTAPTGRLRDASPLSTSLRGILPGNTTNSLVAVGRAGTVLRLRDNHWACPEHPGPADLNDVGGQPGRLLGRRQPGHSPSLGGQHLDRRDRPRPSRPGTPDRLRSQRQRRLGHRRVRHRPALRRNKLDQDPLPNDRHPYGLWIDNDGRAWVVGDRESRLSSTAPRFS